jgi:hypothetical protein
VSERNQRKFESVYSKTVRAGKRRTYFFDVKETRGSDYYLTITESKKRFEDGGYERHKIFLYKEDFNRFMEGLNETIDHVKNDLMPDYDYDEYTRRHEEYLARKEEEEGVQSETIEATLPDSNDDEEAVTTNATPVIEEEVTSSPVKEIEDDLAW